MEATATRVYAISDPHDVFDPGYLQGLDAAIAAAIDYRLTVLEVGERHAPAVPLVLLAQARLDSRNDVPLDTVLRRYLAVAPSLEISSSKRLSAPTFRTRLFAGYWRYRRRSATACSRR
jgi:hypothetical protein